MVETREFESLRDQVKLQQRQISELKARQEEQVLRIDTLNNGFKILGDKAEENARRIDEWDERGLISGNQPAPEPAPVPAAPPAGITAAPPPPPPAPPPSSEPLLLTNQPQPPPEGEVITAGPKAEKLYAGALSLFSRRDYAQATAKFEEFVSTYPDHKLAGNAQYWIGECYYSQKRFREAAEEFAKVEKLFPNSLKVPAAMLKRGLSLWENKKPQDAQAVLEKIVSKYPQSEEAAKAKDKLTRWKQ
jgi:tol-pal system protein YbgF